MMPTRSQRLAVLASTGAVTWGATFALESGCNWVFGTDSPTSAPDVSSDRLNCGRIGHDCLGGGCEGGRCQPLALAVDRPFPFGIAVDPGSDGAVFWTEYEYGNIVRMDKRSRTPQLLLQTGDYAADIVTNAMSLFWSSPDGYTTNGYVRWAMRDGSQYGEQSGAPFGNWYGPTPIGLDVGYVYWGNRWDHQIWRMDLATKHPERLLAEAPDGPELLFIAVDPGSDGHVYWPDGTYLRRMQKDGTNPEIFQADPSEPSAGPLAMDDRFIYWIYGQAGSLVREQKAGGCPTSVCPQVIVNGAYLLGLISLAVDDTFIYWVDNSGGRVMRARKDGGSLAPELLAAQVRVDRVAVDDLAVYWTQASADAGIDDGVVWRWAK
jgi:hypothetical protein